MYALQMIACMSIAASGQAVPQPVFPDSSLTAAVVSHVIELVAAEQSLAAPVRAFVNPGTLVRESPSGRYVYDDTPLDPAFVAGVTAAGARIGALSEIQRCTEKRGDCRLEGADMVLTLSGPEFSEGKARVRVGITYAVRRDSRQPVHIRSLDVTAVRCEQGWCVVEVTDLGGT